MPFGRIDLGDNSKETSDTGDFGIIKMVPWPGGKHLMSDRLIKIFPKHDIYVEPMAGGASTFFMKSDKDPAKVSVINDLNKDLIRLYRATAKGQLRSCSKFSHLRENALVNAAKKIVAKKPNSSQWSPCEYLLVMKASFSGKMASGRPSFPVNASCHPGIGRVMENIDRYEDILKKAKIHNEGFDTVMRRYDSKNTVHYIDPPYVDVKSLYKHETVTPEQIKKVTDKMKGNVVISYNMHPEVERVFCHDKKYKCYSADMRYTINSKKQERGKDGKEKGQIKEIVITNFPLKKGPS